MSGLAVSDSTCLIALERIGHLDLLPRLFTRISIPQAVSDEFCLFLPYRHVTTPTNQIAVSALRTQLKVKGTLGVLLLAKQRSLLTTIEPSLKALRDAGFFMTNQLYEESLRIAGEALPG